MSTSKLQRYLGNLLDKEFPQFRIRENFRPDWLISSRNTRLELDFYIEELKIAFEVQGEQHYQYTPFFHKSIRDFDERKMFDKEKMDICYGNKVTLIEIFTELDADVSVNNIKEKHINKENKLKHILDGERKKENIRRVELLKNQGSYLNCKQRKYINRNSEKEVKNRLKNCIENIKKYESGEITASEEKIKVWKEIVKNNGFVT